MRRMFGIVVLILCMAGAGAGSAFAAVGMSEPRSAQVGSALVNVGDLVDTAQAGAPTSVPSSGSQPVVSQPVNACTCKAAARLAAPPPVPLFSGTAPAPIGGAPNVGGSVILVSTAQQWLWVYQDQRLVYATAVTTGMPALPTPRGTFHVLWRVANTTFYSPWPPGSPYYYSPEHVNYGLYFADYGFFIHDAPWRHCFGPGTNVPHTCPDGTQETGSHGCVNVPTPAGAWLYSNVPNGATVVIR